MADVGNIVPARLFQALQLCYVLKQTHNARALAIVRHDRNDRDPQRAVFGELVMQADRFAGQKDRVEQLPDGFVRHQIHGHFDFHSAEHLHQRGIEVRETPDVVDCGNTVGKAGKQLIELSLLTSQLINRLRQVVAERVERARQDSYLAAGSLVCSGVEPAFGHFDRHVGHFVNRARHAVGAQRNEQYHYWRNGNDRPC
ncbi:hypothetical protein SDC9_87633 [bioreactor metagenome]|uniref:Uncharacterized protein n=1 Tax=bioreactor metagenome TaxID=1076179 RepID=A0A644ZTT7_9ZZZZ